MGIQVRYNESSYDTLRCNTGILLRDALTASATVSIGPLTNINARGGVFFLDIASMPGSASTTVALKVKMVDPAAGRQITIGTLAARASTGISALVIYPGIAASAGSALAQVNLMLPRTFNVVASVSAGATSKDCVFSIGMNLEV